jgi:hypothetical protein
MTRDAASRDLYVLGREGAYHFVGIVLVVWLIVAIGLALLPMDKVIAELGSVAAARLFQMGIALTGIVPLGLWLWWIRRYVRRVSWDASAGQVEMELFRHFGTRTVRCAPRQLAAPSFHRGKSQHLRAPSVDAPYVKVHLEGWTSLIIDLRGDVIDSEGLMTILEGNAPEE